MMIIYDDEHICVYDDEYMCVKWRC